MAESLVTGHLKLADSILAKIDNNPYRIALDRFEWGSNSDILNQAMLLCVAHSLSAEEKYLDGAERINDYIFGKNATGFCFLTGFGSKRVMSPHHRPSGADGIIEPVPGFIVGGPNDDRQDQSDVQESGRVLLASIGARAENRDQCDIEWQEIIRGMTSDHTVLINRQHRGGSQGDQGAAVRSRAGETALRREVRRCLRGSAGCRSAISRGSDHSGLGMPLQIAP